MVMLDLRSIVSLSYAFISTDNSESAFHKDFVKSIESSDVILEVFDTRNQLGTHCVDMEKMPTNVYILHLVERLCIITVYSLTSDILEISQRYSTHIVEELLKKPQGSKIVGNEMLPCVGVMLKSQEKDASITSKICKRNNKLDDPINPGKSQYYNTMPPVRNQREPSEAKIVTKEFNIDYVYNNEPSFIGSLKSANDFNPEDKQL
ncbi:hypothetical protein Lal_00019622 [Lupinus albus]|nr:hypothetical protein Lal_00019622 [Lupinus albus]